MSERLLRGERVWWVCVPVDEADVWALGRPPADVACAEAERIKNEIIRHVDIPFPWDVKASNEIEVRPPEEE